MNANVRIGIGAPGVRLPAARAMRGRSASERGASILIALAFVLVCSMVAAVVISSASANAERIAPHRQTEQSYLSVSSALEAAEKLVTADGSSIRSVVFAKGEGDALVSDSVPYDKLGLAKWAIEQAEADPEDRKAKVVTVDASSAAPKCPTVVVRLVMSGNRSIYLQAFEDVWGGDYSRVPSDIDAVRADLAGRGSYGNVLGKQVFTFESSDNPKWVPVSAGDGGGSS